MSDEKNIADEATILAADHSMMRKLGGVSINSILSPEVTKRAETAITDATDGLYAESMSEGARLEALADLLKNGGDTPSVLERLIATSFSIKAKAGQAGFDLVAALAKSLQNVCEKLPAAEVTSATTQIIEWHIQSLNQILSLKIKGDGGDAGKAILAELDKLNV